MKPVHFIMKIHAILGLLAASLLTVNSAPRLIEIPATASYTNAASHFQFPPQIGDFTREQIHQFDREGRDIGVGYNDARHGVSVTVFIYPVTPQAPNNDLEGHFNTCKADILRLHKEAQIVANRSEQVSAGGQKRNAKYACYAFTEVFAKERQPVRSELYLFSQGKWFIKVRATYPVGLQTVAEPALETFVRDWAWP
jgi:hypothetical protein